MFSKKQLEVIEKIASIPWKGPSRPKLSLEEMMKQFQRNNPQGFHPRKEQKRNNESLKNKQSNVY